MNRIHVTKKISGYIDNEFSQDERKLVAEHLLVCEMCRCEHDELKLGATLASHLAVKDAPAEIWANIENELDGGRGPNLSLIPDPARLSWRNGFALAAAVASVSILAAAAYLNLFSNEPTVSHQTQPQVNVPQAPVLLPPANSGSIVGSNAANNQSAANTGPEAVNIARPQTGPAGPGWEVETVAGRPLIGNGIDADRIAVGELLETDAGSRAKIAVADIGSVEIAPNSRVKLVGTSKSEHRLSLERGTLHAKIFAPPRLFIVDTPSAKAVDLGCEYTLEVDRFGNNILRVTAGFVALEDKGKASIVPAGMMCLTRKGKGLGTPFAADTDAEFRRALEKFDFSGGGSPAVRVLLAKADLYDMVTLWHLLSRVGSSDRGAVYDELSKFVAPPAGVTRGGILNLDKKMLESWRTEVESAWFN